MMRMMISSNPETELLFVLVAFKRGGIQQMIPNVRGLFFTARATCFFRTSSHFVLPAKMQHGWSCMATYPG